MRHAVVIGAGMAGCAAAAALRPLVQDVTVLERDVLPSGPAPRRGVPQGEQLHNLLGRAQQHLEELLPGFLDELQTAGCGTSTVSSGTHVHELGIRMPERDLGMRLVATSRPTLDHVAASMIRRLGVQVIDDCPALEIAVRDGSVDGVVARRSGRAEHIPADIVVDASGPAALGAACVGERSDVPLDVRTKHVDQWYVSVVVRLEDPSRDDGRFLMVFPTPPGTRGGLVSPTGDHRWYVSLSGRSGDPIPRSFDDMVAFARELEDPVIAAFLAGAVACSEPRTFRKVVATWRRFDRHPTSICGLFPIGDAVASLNPLFGQGVSVAAWQAAELRSTLQNTAGLDAATSTYADRAASIVDAAWSLGEAVAQALVVHRDGIVVDLTRSLGRLVDRDPELHERYVRVWHMLEPADVLREPALVERLLQSHDEARSAGAER